jgi:uncharacterized protein DUF4953/uncharacterized protein DUF5117/uncharacterized protein DUF5118
MKHRPGFLFSILLVCSSIVFSQQPQPQPSPAAAPTTSPAADAKKPAEKPPEPPKDKPFADVVKDAQVVKGLFTLYRTDEKVFLEILPDQFDKIFLVALTVDSGIGERGFYAAAMAGEAPFVFHKQGKNVQLMVRNTRFHADNGPMQRAVARSFSDSIVGITKIESLPHPERKSVLIDFGALLLTDLPMLSYDLEATFRIPYRFDPKNSVFGTVKAFPQNVEVETIAHYATERPPLPPMLAPGQPPPPLPPPPGNLPDVRSMLFHLRYSISERPQTGFRPRLADARVGHFVNSIEDYSDDDRSTTTKRFVNRWHLVKQDPSAAFSPPKQPIVFWLENTIPVKYRDAIRDGILMWNKAFERIGFQNAIEVKVQPDDADWDPGDTRYSTIRWFAGYPDPGFAQGPSRTDPVTGQIYDADIRFSEAMTRFSRREVAEQILPAAMPWEYSAPRAFVAPWSVINANYQCDFASGAVKDAEFAFDLLTARGMDPNGAEADKFIKDFLRAIAAHEVGHTLGLRHNFRASTIHTFEQAQDAGVTGRDGLTGSVMDYIPTNIAARGGKQGEYHQSTLGPYDYWAIEYAYKPIDSATVEGEQTELRKIASRAAEPQLAYDTDEDAGFGPGLDMDPVVNRFDLGTDPLKYYAHRVGLAREIWTNMEQRLERPGEGYQVLRRSFNSALGQTANSLFLASKYIGGMYHYRSHVGDPGNRLPFEPVPAEKQRQALTLLRDNLFAPTAFQFKPQLLNKLENERFIDFNNFTPGRMDVPIHQVVLSLQRQVLDRIFMPTVLSRIQDSELRVAGPAEPFTLGMLFTEVQDSVWAETKTAGASVNINSYRRSLQREHLRKMIGMVLRDAAVPEDARTLARQSLVTLRGQLQRTVSRPGLSTSLEVRAHLNECIARIDEALKGGLQRSAF